MGKQLLTVAVLIIVAGGSLAQTAPKMKPSANLVAKNIRDSQRYRFRLFKYAALGE
jgi:hypothetical protein